MEREFGVGRGKVFPASKANSLLNPLRRLVQPPSRLADRLDVPEDSVVIEIGCGPGYFSASLAARVPDGRLVVFDLQREMLERARSRMLPGGDALQGDATMLPLRSSSIDAVVVVLVLGEVPDRELCIREIRRVLRPGGAALFAETRRDSDFIRLEELRGLVEPHGFDLVARHGRSWEYTARFRAR